MSKANDSTKITYNNNLDNDRHFKRETTYLHLRILGAPPVSSEGEGSPTIWPLSKANDSTKITYNNNLDNDRHFKRETTYLHLRILGAPPVSSEGNDRHTKIACKNNFWIMIDLVRRLKWLTYRDHVYPARWLYRSPNRTRSCWSGKISGVNECNGLLPAKKILARFRQCLAVFWRVICHWRQIDTYIVLSQRKKDLNPSPIDQKGRPFNKMIGLTVLQGDVK